MIVIFLDYIRNQRVCVRIKKRIFSLAGRNVTKSHCVGVQKISQRCFLMLCNKKILTDSQSIKVVGAHYI